MNWKLEFRVPIVLPCGVTLRTLDDARSYIRRLPRKRRGAKWWQSAGWALENAAKGKPQMPAVTAIGYAVYRDSRNSTALSKVA